MSREFDVLILGATGITGRIALEYLTARTAALGRSFAVGARDATRVDRLCDERSIPRPAVFDVDVTDAAQLASFAARGSVLVNLVGPYTASAEAVVRACVEAGTSYLDLTAETQLVREVDGRWHDAAVEAGVAVVQTAGFEALPADLAVEIAREQLRGRGERLASADVQVSIKNAPSARLADSISGGTAQSILTVFRDRRDPALNDIAFRVRADSDAALVRTASPIRLWPRITSGQVIAPMVPVAFINPPVIHRSAWLLALESGERFIPLRYRDGMRFGRSRGISGGLALLAAGVQAVAQALVIAAGSWPWPIRRALAAVLGRVLPASGSGPSGPQLENWRWRLRLTALSDARAAVVVTLDADGHPGYTTTSRMISELALIIADGTGTGRSGCITPALAAGVASADRFTAAGMRFNLG